jgi:hypothetical protein
MADSPILLFSTDPFLGAALEVVGHGARSVVKHALPSDLSEWPNGEPYNVVLDVPPAHRKAAHETVRLHHQGRLILVLGPDEDDADLPRDAARLTVHRPIDLASLLSLLAEPIAGSNDTDREIAADDRSREAPEGDASPGRGQHHPDPGAAVTPAQPVATLPYGVAVDRPGGGPPKAMPGPRRLVPCAGRSPPSRGGRPRPPRLGPLPSPGAARSAA